MCSRVEPCSPPHLPIPISVLLPTRSPSSFAPSNSPNPGSRLCLHERMFLSFSLSLPSNRSFVSPSLSLSFFLPLSPSPASVSVLRSAALFVLEIRRGLPDPPFSCAVINYYLLAIHPRTRYPRKGCETGEIKSVSRGGFASFALFTAFTFRRNITVSLPFRIKVYRVQV